VIRGADLDPTDVADAGHPSSVVGFDDDVGELLGRGQPAERFDVDLISFVTRGRRLVQDTGRDLKILCAQHGEHVAGGAIVGRRLVWVEPDAHRIFATALELHVADARQARQHVLDVQGRVVRQVERVAGHSPLLAGRVAANTPGVSKASGFGAVARAWIVPLDRLSALSTKSRVPCRANSVSPLSAISTLSARPPLSRARSREKVRKSDSLISKSR